MGLFGPSNYDLQRDISRLHVLIVTLLNYLQTSLKTQETRMATLQEYVSDIKAALTETSDEFDAKLDQLAQSLASQGQLTPDQEALLDDLRAQARALADKVPNPEPEPEEDLEEEDDEDEDLDEDPEDADPVE